MTAVNKCNDTFLHSALRSKVVPKDKVVKYIDSIEDEVFKDVVNLQNTKVEPLLCIAIEHDYHQCVEKLYKAANDKDEYVNTPNNDIDKESPLHLAAKMKKFATLKTIVETFRDKIKLQAKDKHGFSVLHIAIRQGDAEAVAHLIRSGCDLAARDNEGNTPLHCLVEQAALACDDEDRLKPHLNVWQKVVEEVLHWWFRKIDGRRYAPHISKKDYRLSKRDALYYLRSELKNKNGLSVIQYAAQEGVSALVRDMIWVEDIFIIPEEKQRNWKNRDLVTITVTNLMPQVKSDEVKYSGISDRNKWREFKDLKKGDEMGQNEEGMPVRLFDNWDISFSGNDKTLIRPFLRIKHPNKAAEVMNIQPLKQLVRDHWFVCQWLTVVIMVAHLVHMVFYTNYCTDATLATFRPNVSGQTNVDPNYLYIIWPSVLIVSELVSMCYVFVYVVWTFQAGRRFSWSDILQLIEQQFEKHVEDYIDLKDVFKWPSFIMSLIASVGRFVLVWLFFVLTLSALLHTSQDVGDEFNDLILSSVFIGWIMIFYWARSFEPVYRFTTALYIMIIKDMISWFLFFVLVLLAFSSAFYMILQTVPNLDPDFPWDHFHFIVYDFLLKGCGMQSKISAEDVSEKMKLAGMNPVPFEFLYTVYAIITGVFFYGMLTSTMFTTYGEFVQTSKYGWRQNSLAQNKSWLSDMLAENILHPFFKTVKITSRKVYKSPNSGHYYITMSKKEKNEYMKSFRMMKSSAQEYEWPDMSTGNNDPGTNDKGRQTDNRENDKANSPSKRPNRDHINDPNIISQYVWTTDTKNHDPGHQSRPDENDNVENDRMTENNLHEDEMQDIYHDNAETDPQIEFNTPPESPNPLRREQCSLI